jgi:hypothetical protein
VGSGGNESADILHLLGGLAIMTPALVLIASMLVLPVGTLAQVSSERSKEPPLIHRTDGSASTVVVGFVVVEFY